MCTLSDVKHGTAAAARWLTMFFLMASPLWKTHQVEHDQPSCQHLQLDCVQTVFTLSIGMLAGRVLIEATSAATALATYVRAQMQSMTLQRLFNK